MLPSESLKQRRSLRLWAYTIGWGEIRQGKYSKLPRGEITATIFFSLPNVENPRKRGKVEEFCGVDIYQTCPKGLVSFRLAHFEYMT